MLKLFLDSFCFVAAHIALLGGQCQQGCAWSAAVLGKIVYFETRPHKLQKINCTIAWWSLLFISVVVICCSILSFWIESGWSLYGTAKRGLVNIGASFTWTFLPLGDIVCQFQQQLWLYLSITTMMLIQSPTPFILFESCTVLPSYCVTSTYQLQQFDQGCFSGTVDTRVCESNPFLALVSESHLHCAFHFHAYIRM